MTSKDRVIAMLKHQIPDRVPRGENAFDCHFYEQVTGKKTLAYAGWDELEAIWSGRRDEVVADYIDTICTISEVLGWDYIRMPVAPRKMDYTGYKRTGSMRFCDAQGNEFLFNPVVGNIVTPASYNEDMTVDELPDPDAEYEIDDSELDIARGVIARMGQTHFMIGRLPVGGPFPYMETVGMSEYLIRMITDRPFLDKASRYYTKQALKYAAAFIKAGCHGIMEAEDYADSRGLIMGKARYDEFLAPYLKKLTDGVHQLGGYMIKHTDGYMMDGLESFVEMGIDAWHGIQPSIGMDIRSIRNKIGNRLCLFGGVNVETYILGTTDEVREEVRQAIKYGVDGGIVIAGGNILEPGVKPENYYVVIDEIEKHDLTHLR